jgi:UTP--glucose-1-phosphate uridylyltransferase
VASPKADPFEPLRRWGFDRDLFSRWQKAVAEGQLSKANNVVHGELRAPPPRTIKQLPGGTTKARAELHRRGAAAIARGELGVVVLNGGMATRFGGGVKGTVSVLGNRSFLALAMQDVQLAQQRHGGKVQVFLMNSFATDELTRQHFDKHGNFGLDAAQVHHFTQFVSVRMQKNGEPFKLENGELSPYGPGHGDFPAAFRGAGLLDRFRQAGGRWLLVRNVDNLGARVDPAILGHHIQSGAEVTVEVAPKWPEDVGGAPYLLDDRVQLVEQLRYPEGFRHDIVDVFNCNTFTFTANALDREFDLGWYFVEKTVENRKAVQIERLIGEVTRVLSSNFLRVRRSGADSRFLPVKTPEDLEAAREEIAEMYAEETPPA